MMYTRQKGFILITILVLMTMLTALAVTQASSNSTQTRVAANATDTEVSFQKTEGALNEAVNQIISHNYTPQHFQLNSSGLYLFDTTATPLWKSINWNSTTQVVGSFSGSTTNQANYIIEQLPSVVQPGQSMRSSTRVYRITSRATGANGNSSVLLQSTIQIQQ